MNASSIVSRDTATASGSSAAAATSRCSGYGSSHGTSKARLPSAVTEGTDGRRPMMSRAALVAMR